MKVREVVVHYGFPEHICVMTYCQDDDLWWEDVAEEEAIEWNYHKGNLDIFLD